MRDEGPYERDDRVHVYELYLNPFSVVSSAPPSPVNLKKQPTPLLLRACIISGLLEDGSMIANCSVRS
jgi:hypothetical protein